MECQVYRINGFEGRHPLKYSWINGIYVWDPREKQKLPIIYKTRLAYWHNSYKQGHIYGHFNSESIWLKWIQQGKFLSIREIKRILKLGERQ